MKHQRIRQIRASSQSQQTGKVAVILRGRPTADRNQAIPEILRLHPGIVIGAPDLRRRLIGISPGQQPGEDENAQRDQRTRLHKLPVEVI